MKEKVQELRHTDMAALAGFPLSVSFKKTSY